MEQKLQKIIYGIGMAFIAVPKQRYLRVDSTKYSLRGDWMRLNSRINKILIKFKAENDAAKQKKV
jgi:hypothetical protein